MTRLSDERREYWAQKIAEDVLRCLDYSDVADMWEWELEPIIADVGADESEEFRAITHLITDRARVSFM